MSRSKDSTSKKRKLADVEQDAISTPPRKALVLQNDSTGDGRNDVPDAGDAPTLTAKDSELETGSATMIGEMERGKKADPIGPKDIQNLDHVSQVAKDMVGEDRIDGASKSNFKDKAALRQAKSERRSKKKRKPEVVDTPGVTEPSTTLQAAVHVPNDQEQHPHEPSIPEEAFSTNLSKPEPKQRFIVFVGNLPYTTTTTSIRTHFSKLEPFTVRHSTDKATGRSRGFAFLEFEGYDRMETCLKLYHHSLFDAASGGGDGDSLGSGKRKKSQARRINIELTAGGGGGKSAARKERIKGKNEKLEGERERARVHREKEEAAANRKKRKAAGEKTGANAVEITGVDEDIEDDNIHPSRRKRMKT